MIGREFCWLDEHIHSPQYRYIWFLWNVSDHRLSNAYVWETGGESCPSNEILLLSSEYKCDSVPFDFPWQVRIPPSCTTTEGKE
jgi:hypothetical protein